MKYIVLLLLFGKNVDDLASPDYQVRESAEKRLTQYGDLTWPILDKHFPDKEQNKRAKRIISKVIPQNPPSICFIGGRVQLEWWDVSHCNRGWMGNVRPTVDGLWTLAYALPSETSKYFEIINYYNERTRTQYHWKVWQLDSDGREASKLMIKDMLHAGIPPGLVRKLVTHMEHRFELISSGKETFKKLDHF